MKWLLKQGGLAKIDENNKAKANLLYECIDSSEGFYTGFARKEDRSLMNVSFKSKNAELDALFVKEAEANSMLGLKGHRLLGGLRASIYNAITLEQVKELCAFMNEFKKKYA